MSLSRPPHAVTLREVAEEAGLSVSAVSMALKDHPRISQETKERVRRIAAGLGYVPNSAGRALRARRADAIAVIVPNTSHHVFGHTYFMKVLTGVNEVAIRHDAQLVISTNPDDAEGGMAYERVMKSGSVDGAIVTSASVDDPGIGRLIASGLPVVLLGRFPHLPDAVSVGIDDRAAERLATEHLVRVHGRRRLVHLSGPLDHQAAMDRRDGFLDAMRETGAEGRVVEGDFSEESGYRVGRTLAADGLDGLDGLVAGNDDMAYGAMVALQEAGRTVPQDVAVVGFDDFGLSRVTTPAIATVHVPAERWARQATERLFDLILGAAAGHEPAPVLPVELVPRRSCGCEDRPRA
ncbi:MAG TPA: LacI family DNA-binding transcriptional regulator [Cellulomonas sp.]